MSDDDDAREWLQRELDASLVDQDDKFAHGVTARVRIRETFVQRAESADGRRRVLSAAVVSECAVEKDMLHGGHLTHGGCTAYLADLCTSFAFKLHARESGRNLRVGPTQTLNVVYHAPGIPGTILRIAATSLSINDRLVSGKCEVWDTTNKRLVVSAIIVRGIERARL
ncbi:hypothetical protein BKA62DRAFT_694421 [Auriculariales sp. MPI-PUGE-AT-0066]|nr:hypothetical protein BKA62DRAFT_694421 [Auriculariales sp. MPI-PUGE-AT-0066]